jgi:hypothetical protein
VGGIAQVALRGVGENSENQNSVSGSADDTVRVPHLVPKSAGLRPVRFASAPIYIGAWELQASVSPTPSVADPGVTTDRIAVSRVMSPG